jgi:Fe-S-cluster containining protein
LTTSEVTVPKRNDERRRGTAAAGKAGDETRPGPSPANWELDQLKKELFERLREAAEEEELQLSSTRLRYEVEQSAECQQLLQSWPQMNGAERMESWKNLLVLGIQAVREISPLCIRCADCCSKGSPTLHLSDLERVRSERIPLHQLVTIRKGEPARIPGEGDPFFLPDERIKVKEKPDGSGCVFLDAAEKSCTIYEQRPAQCRAQACWDISEWKKLAREDPPLNRYRLFEGVDELTVFLQEHDRRCSFDALREAFENIERTGGRSLDDAVQAVAFEDHFRNFVTEQLKLPPEAMELFFGRSFQDRLRLFGFRVEQEPDGTRVVLPDGDRSSE